MSIFESSVQRTLTYEAHFHIPIVAKSSFVGSSGSNSSPVMAKLRNYADIFTMQYIVSTSVARGKRQTKILQIEIYAFVSTAATYHHLHHMYECISNAIEYKFSINHLARETERERERERERVHTFNLDVRVVQTVGRAHEHGLT